MDQLILIKELGALGVFIIAALAGFFPLFKRYTADHQLEFPKGEALASGVFLGAALMHMLPDAAGEFDALRMDFPVAYLLAGIAFLALLWLEHLGREFYEHEGGTSASFAGLAVILLSVHSLLAGAALGLTDHLSLEIIILLSILAHKWAASFALAIYIAKSNMSRNVGLAAFAAFALMTPFGILVGDVVLEHVDSVDVLEPTFTALAAGTFLYLGTLHGLKQAVMVKRCCNLPNYSFVIIGFTIMAVVAAWL